MTDVTTDITLTCPVCGGKWTARGMLLPEGNRVKLMQFPTHALTLNGRPCAGSRSSVKPD